MGDEVADVILHLHSDYYVQQAPCVALANTMLKGRLKSPSGESKRPRASGIGVIPTLGSCQLATPNPNNFYHNLMASLFTEDLWQSWVIDESKNYKKESVGNQTRNTFLKKGYLHFDQRIWFPSHLEEIRKIVSQPEKVAKWQFYPFVKVINSTPRFKYSKKHARPIQSIKRRPICYSAHKDSLIYGFYSHCLTEKYQQYIRQHEFSDCVLAYRTDLESKCNIQFASEVFDYIDKEIGECIVYALDIKSFFDTLNHKVLLANWRKVIDDIILPNDQYQLFKTLTRFGYVKEQAFLRYLGVDYNKLRVSSAGMLNKNAPLGKAGHLPKTLLELSPYSKHSRLFNKLRENGIFRVNGKLGIPQGSPMSAVLSNIYMLEFDTKLNTLAKQLGCRYRRYCDDILLICPTESAEKMKEEAYNQIEICELKIQKDKEEEIWFRKDSKGNLRAFNGKEIRKNTKRFKPDKEHLFYKTLQYLGFEFTGQDILIRSSSLCRYHRKRKRRINKSVKMAYSPRAKGDKLLSKATLWRYSHVGSRNFLSYAYKCASITYTSRSGRVKKGLASPAIKRQVSAHMRTLRKELEYKNKDRHEHVKARGRPSNFKRI